VIKDPNDQKIIQHHISQVTKTAATWAPRPLGENSGPAPACRLSGGTELQNLDNE
jgi:hypothetical protein